MAFRYDRGSRSCISSRSRALSEACRALARSSLVDFMQIQIDQGFTPAFLESALDERCETRGCRRCPFQRPAARPSACRPAASLLPPWFSRAALAGRSLSNHSEAPLQCQTGRIRHEGPEGSRTHRRRNGRRGMTFCCRDEVQFP